MICQFQNNFNVIIVLIRVFRCRDEIDQMAKYELEHIILMLKVILADKNKCPEKSDLDFNFVLKDEHLHEIFYERLLKTLRHFDQKHFF